VLTVRLDADPAHFDAHQHVSYTVLWPVAACCNQLVQFDPLDHTRILPDLAERWEVSPDGKVYTFYLKRGVKFHHGKPFKAEDVKASFERIIWPPAGVVSPRKEIYGAVEGIETPDDYTVRFFLKRPMPSFLPNVALGFNVIYPKDILDARGDMKRDLVGTGPFKLKEYRRGVSLELVKNPEYHVPGRPYLDGIMFFVIPDLNTAFSALVAGQLLLQRTFTDPGAEELKRQLGDKVAVETVPSTFVRAVDLNSRRRPWDDPRVRTAVSLAVDRNAAVQVVSKGQGVVSGPMLPGGQWALPREELLKLPGYAADKGREIEQARALLRQAGYPEGIRGVEILARKGPDWEPQAVFIQDQLARIGIQATIKAEEAATHQARLDRYDFDVHAHAYAVPIDDPDTVFGQNYLCGSTRNYSGVCDPEVDALFERQSQATDLNERRGLVRELERKVLLANIKVLTARELEWSVYWRKVRNFRTWPSRYLTERLEHVWLAES
jgi:peptide/nickel transport system substrate-binding protein